MSRLAKNFSRSLRDISAVAAMAISIAGCASHDPSDVEGPLGDPNVVAKLRELALQTSSIAGVPSPQKMYAVAVSDHQTAETVLSGATINDHAPVFVIVMTGGTFTSTEAPPGGAAPQGTVLTVTLEQTTYEATDSGIGNVEPDLSEIASATVDLNAR